MQKGTQKKIPFVTSLKNNKLFRNINNKERWSMLTDWRINIVKIFIYQPGKDSIHL